MCSTYKAFGAAGLITSGTGRDLDQVEALNFPAFTNGTICAHGYCHMLSLNVPVSVGGMTVYPGALLHGDRNGVCSIPVEIASEVGGVCQEVAVAEAIILNYLKESQPTKKPRSVFRQPRPMCLVSYGITTVESLCETGGNRSYLSTYLWWFRPTRFV